MADKQWEFHRWTPSMHDSGGRNGLDRIEPAPELALDLGKRPSRGYDKDIGAGMIIGVRSQTILPRIQAEADNRYSPAERVIDFAGFVPF